MKTMNIQKVKAWIFDLDGTLIDARVDAWLSAIRNAYRELRGREVSSLMVEEFHAHDKLETIFPDLWSDEVRDCIRPAMQMFYDPEPLQGSDELLKLIRENGGKSSIATARPHPAESVAALLPDWTETGLIDHVLTAHTFPMPFESKTEMIRQAIEEFGLDPAEVAMVGDSVIDVKSGAEAGVGFVIGVESGKRHKRILIEAGAHCVVPSVDDIRSQLREELGTKEMGVWYDASDENENNRL
jgi:phosphoglycolate phosphatase-like HAD superfamily hydrolase